MSTTIAERVAVAPLPTGYGPASAAVATIILEQQLQLDAQDGTTSVTSGSEGDSDPDSTGQRSAAAKTESSHQGQRLGLDGTTEGGSGPDGQDDDEVDDGPGRGNWAHGQGAAWTTEQDLEVLRIYQQYPGWTHNQVAVEFNNRFPNERARTGQALRQRRNNLRKKGETVDTILAKMPGGGKGGGNGSGGAAGGAAGAIAA